MSDEKSEATPASKKGGKLGLIIALVLACGAAVGGYYVANTGLFPPLETTNAEHSDDHQDSSSNPAVSVAFVPMPPMVVSLGQDAAIQLRFQAQFEVDPFRQEEIEHLMPRIQDVLNGYLRAVELDVLKKPSSLIRIRAQMLRRIQLVSGPGSVRDLLITEFVFG